jgi:hypothetical protein
MTLAWHRPISQQEQILPSTNQQIRNTLQRPLQQSQYEALIGQQKQRVSDATTTSNEISSTAASPSKSDDHHLNRNDDNCKRTMLSLFYGGNHGLCNHVKGMISKMLIVLLLISVGMILCMMSRNQTIILPQVTVISTTTVTTTKGTTDNVMEDNSNNVGQQLLRGASDQTDKDESNKSSLNKNGSKTTATSVAISKSNKQIRQISIIGERNSGTRWTFE